MTAGGTVSPGLLGQLMLGRLQGFTPVFQDSDTTTDIINIPFTTILETITSVINFSRDFDISSGDNVVEIRFSGRDILTNINAQEDLSPSEKADALRTAASELSEYLEEDIHAREYKALKYVIRILTARESYFRRTTEFIEQLFS